MKKLILVLVVVLTCSINVNAQTQVQIKHISDSLNKRLVSLKLERSKIQKQNMDKIDYEICVYDAKNKSDSTNCQLCNDRTKRLSRKIKHIDKRLRIISCEIKWLSYNLNPKNYMKMNCEKGVRYRKTL